MAIEIIKNPRNSMVISILILVYRIVEKMMENHNFTGKIKYKWIIFNSYRSHYQKEFQRVILVSLLHPSNGRNIVARPGTCCVANESSWKVPNFLRQIFALAFFRRWLVCKQRSQRGYRVLSLDLQGSWPVCHPKTHAKHKETMQSWPVCHCKTHAKQKKTMQRSNK